jgi:UDP-glucose 4-epimerase
MQILITGGCGFIGSHLAARLKGAGHQITVLDNMSTGNPLNLAGEKGITIVEGDCRDVASLVPERVGLILHLGIASTTTLYLKDRNLVSKEIQGAMAIYEKAIKDGAKVVIASSSSLYNLGNLPSRERDIIQVTDFYTECRYAIERMAKLYSDIYGMKAVVLRMFAVYGGIGEVYKKQYANMVTKLTWQILQGQNPRVYGDGRQTRDFTYISDVLNAWEKAIEYNENGYVVFNVGTGQQTDFIKLIKMIQKKAGTNLTIEHEDNPLPNFVHDTCADTDCARRKLKFKAEIDLAKGIDLLLLTSTETAKKVGKI